MENQMNDITDLFHAVEEAAERLSWLAAININGRTTEERIQMDLAYKRAQNDWADKQKAYWRAVDEAAKVGAELLR